MGSKKAKSQKAIKTTSDIKPQAPVAAVTKDLVTVLDKNRPLIARTNLNLEQVEFQNDLFTKDLLKTVRVHAEIIQTLLTTQSQIDIRIGEELHALKNQFLAYATKNSLDKATADDAFNEFVQEVFDLRPSRASEYIRVANKKSLEGLELPISSLVELCRLEDEALEDFLEEYPAEELSKKSFREVQALVRENNDNKVERKSSKTIDASPAQTSEATADAIKSALESVKSDSETAHQVSSRDSVVLLEGEVENYNFVQDENVDQANEPTAEDLEILTAKLRVAFNELKPLVEKLELTKLGTTKNAYDLLMEISQFFLQAASKKGDGQ